MAPSLIAKYYVAQTGAQGTGALTTPSFTPSNDEIIVIGLETWDTAVSMSAPTGGSQTYTSRIIDAPGGFNPWVGIYTAKIAGSPGAMTISSTPSGSARYSMCVERWGSADLAATPVTASGNNTTGAVVLSITPSSGTSILSWVGGDAQSIDPATRAYLGSGVDEGTRDDHVGANGVGYHGYQASTGTSAQNVGLSAPTGSKFGVVAIEVLALASSAPSFPPQPQSRRRIQPTRRRPRAAAPVRAQVNPPFPLGGFKQARRLRGLLPRRGEAFMPVPTQIVTAAPNFVPQAVRTRLRGLRLFRGHAVTPTPVQVVVAPPVFPAQVVRVRRWALRAVRGRTVVPPIDQATAATQTQRPRLRPFRTFRSRLAQPVPAQTVVAAPTYPPQSVRTRLRGLRLGRSRAATPVPAQIAVVPPTYVPLSVRARLKGLLSRRSRSVAPPPGQSSPAATAHQRPRGLAPRRGHAVMPPPQVAVVPPAYPVRSVRSRLKGLRSNRGREAATPVPAQVVIVPPKFPPLFSRIKQHAARIFRGQTRTPVAPVCDCQTHRPNAGTTARPSSGITARPGSGTTARPAMGMTARPDTGTTARPCTCQSGG